MLTHQGTTLTKCQWSMSHVTFGSTVTRFTFSKKWGSGSFRQQLELFRDSRIRDKERYVLQILGKS